MSRDAARAILRVKAQAARRRFLRVGAALALQAGALPLSARAESADGSARAGNAGGGTRISLAEFGGIPGADASALVDAFNKAFAHLRAAGGGELRVPPGLYDFGSVASGGRLVSVEDARNVLLTAHGAVFRLHTSARVIPCMFYFSNPEDVAIVGASFEDTGADTGVNWRGMYCVKADATRPCAGFQMRDCHVNGAVGLFQSLQHGRHRFMLKDIRLQATVKNAYYGAGLTYVGDGASVDLACENVRRGCIAYGLKNADIRIGMRHAADAPASNGFISLICEGDSAGNVEQVRIRLEASGAARHSGLIHFYHQKEERGGHMRDIDVHVALKDLQRDGDATSVFVFDHELAGGKIRSSTARAWDRITLTGTLSGSAPGKLIHNPSVSTAPGTVYIDRRLAEHADLSQLSRHFRIRPG